METQDLEIAKIIFGKYIFETSGGSDYVNEDDLKEAKQEKVFIESFDFEILRKELLEKINTEIQEIEEALF